MNILWRILGLALVFLGCWLLTQEKQAVFLPLVLVGLAMLSPEQTAQALRSAREFLAPGKQAEPSPSGDKKDALLTQNQDVTGFGQGPPAPDEWSRVLRPVLHQASYYTVPTYYLNLNLHFIDWNVAFEVVFGELLPKLRNKHVNYFIAELENAEEVFDHAREFTAKVERGELPLVDMEPLSYKSAKYGHTSYLKVAAQLHTPTGELHGWAVALAPREIDWAAFQRDLYKALEQDKLWSLYASAYDRILLEFSEYRALIRAVTEAVPAGSRSVADLGAGTGNVTTALLKAGYRVTAVENNLAMLDRLRAKHRDEARLTVVKSSVEDLHSLKAGSFDAAVMMNVLYAVDDPLACLRGIGQILKPEGILCLTTTHKDTSLDPLLKAIKDELRKGDRFNALEADYERIYEINKHIERTLARRYSIEDYRGWLKDAGFEILKVDPNAYVGAVVLIHARRLATPSAVSKAAGS